MCDIPAQGSFESGLLHELFVRGANHLLETSLTKNT